MKTVTLEICGETIEMPVGFITGTALAKAGVDPLQFALRVDRNSSLTSESMIKVLHIGARAGGSKLTLEQIGTAVYDAGALDWVPVTIEYLSAFCSAAPEHPVKQDPKELAPTQTH